MIQSNPPVILHAIIRGKVSTRFRLPENGWTWIPASGSMLIWENTCLSKAIFVLQGPWGTSEYLTSLSTLQNLQRATNVATSCFILWWKNPNFPFCRAAVVPNWLSWIPAVEFLGGECRNLRSFHNSGSLSLIRGKISLPNSRNASSLISRKFMHWIPQNLTRFTFFPVQGTNSCWDVIRIFLHTLAITCVRLPLPFVRTDHRTRWHK